MNSHWGKHENTVLVLQGGGALGAYQAGVFEGLAECGAAPDWVAGVSIGAINAALIAGNPRERRVERLHEFWHRVSAQLPFTPPASMDLMRPMLDQMSTASAFMFGVPGFFSPRMVPPFLAPDGSIGALSFYDTQPLKATLEELVDFDLINRHDGVRLSLGAVDLSNGNSVYFDSHATKIRAEHVLASGALPPGFPPVEIDGRLYWDGGIVSNTPLWYVLDADSRMDALIIQVDVFSGAGELPKNLAEVQERAKDIQYASKTRFNTNRMKELEVLRDALRRLLGKLPGKLRDDPDVRKLAAAAEPKSISLVHFINRHHPRATSFKDCEFSRVTVNDLWQGGLTDVRSSLADPKWHRATVCAEGMRVYDMAPQGIGLTAGWQSGPSLAALLLAAACSLAPAAALAQRFEPKGVDVQKAANAVLSMMGLMLTPDVTTGSLAFSNDATGNPDFSMTSLGGGFTTSRSFPLYLEGTAGLSRYDPTFIASNGTEERAIPLKWNVVTVTGGVGWDFPVATNLVLRPMFNFSYGHVESDASLGGRFLEYKAGEPLEFLDGGKLDAYGLGGAVMLDYEDYRPEREIDVELRYTNIRLQSFGGTSEAVKGSSDAQTVNLWTRYRAPTGMVMLERPVRYVLEYVYTRFLGDLDGVLGFNHLNSVGAGLELDTGKYDTIISRMRLVGRYKFGDNVTGWSLSFAVSF